MKTSNHIKYHSYYLSIIIFEISYLKNTKTWEREMRLYGSEEPRVQLCLNIIQNDFFLPKMTRFMDCPER